MASLVFPMAKRMLRTSEAAQDAVQLSMLKLWEKRNVLNECESMKAFVFRVVRNTCLDEIKKKAPMSIDDYEKIPHGNVVHSNFDNEEAVEWIIKIINQLPKNQKEVIQMRDLDGLGFEEIAEVLNYDLPYIRVLLSRARKSVKKELNKIYCYEATGTR